ncbi:DUF484 family protein [Pseudomonas sp. F1_0610]|uniref:DUF484 family protein n=1 Tax=Pseudomonas sp. F1_0610 TaxID=3114284 RepID=UPI0039C4639B
MSKALTAEQVAEYLLQNPHFFAEHDDVLANLQIPHVRGTSVSLVERQLTVLRQRNDEMRKRLSHLMRVARDNDRLFDKTRRLLLEMLDAQSIEDAIGCIDEHMRHIFKVPFFSLILFAEQPVAVGRTESLAKAKAAINSVLNSTEKSMCGLLRPVELEFLFGKEQGKEVGSAAVVAIEYQQLYGVIAIGSADPNHYNSQVDTLFLRYIAQVFARLLPELCATVRIVK